MSSNISDPLPKKSDNPGENIRKTSGDLDETKKALVTTNETFVKEVNNDMVDKKRKKILMWQKKPSLILFQKRNLTQ